MSGAEQPPDVEPRRDSRQDVIPRRPVVLNSGSPFPPIADYAFLSDSHTGALVAPNGAVEWMCLPHFDGESIFGALLDRAAGSFRVAPYGVDVPATRRYVPGTNMLETTWMTPTGWVVVTDALTVGPWHEGTASSHTRAPTDYDADHLLVRMIECTQGMVSLEVVCEPMFGYGSRPAEWSMVENERYHALDATDGTATVRLLTDMRAGIDGNRAHARHRLAEGDRAFCALSWTEELGGPRTSEEAMGHIDETSRAWRQWLAGANFPDHPWREYLQRSALVLRGLCFQPTGALVAAATTSLPETPGGERNWDYRYCWMRDASFALWGLHAIGLDYEAEDFMQYVADLERDEDGALQIMYGIRGERDLEERTLDHLHGYEASRPVRVGNGAYNQRQNDVYGAVLDSVYLHVRNRDHLPERLWPVLHDQVESARRVWMEPDQGIWEARGAPQQYVSSKLMCWVALDRGARLATLHGDEDLAAEWQQDAEQIRRDILEHGVSERGVFRQHYDTDALDASTLLVPLVRFLPADDERVRATVLAIADELTTHGLVLRYRVDETDDGLHGEEGTFLICSFWLVSALSEIGETERACAMCERLLSHASPLALYAEELDALSGRHLGNFPQAFTHLALINAVMHVIADGDRLAAPASR
jgi:GH15 family glucan-1,4-alpha-glucosidase